VRQVLGAVGCGDRQRGALEPVAVGVVDFHDLRAGPRGCAARQYAVGFPCQRVSQAGVGEGENLLRIDMAPALEGGPVGLGKAVIEEAPAGAVDIGHHAVEHLTSVLVLVEASRYCTSVAGRTAGWSPRYLRTVSVAREVSRVAAG